MHDNGDSIARFLAAGSFAVVGASKDRGKFGNKVLRAYQESGLPVVGIHPRETEVETARCYPDLASVPERPDAVSLVVPPDATERVVSEGLGLGIRLFWMQPGSESDAAIAAIQAAGGVAIGYGPCVLVELPRRMPG